MSELIKTHTNHALVRGQLLATASALALTAYIASTILVKAEDADRPTVWIELGGQMEELQGWSSPLTAPFMSAMPEPGSYSDDIFSGNQRTARLAFGLEGSIAFQPEASDWKFSASIRYGRSKTKRHSHEQGPAHFGYKYQSYARLHRAAGNPKPLYAAAFADAAAQYSEQHAVLDFSAGKDIGVGMLGRNSDSMINVGVRIAQFSSRSDINSSARPSVTSAFFKSGALYKPFPQFNQFAQSGHADRNFHGIGPSLSWEASVALTGNRQDGELALDWGINGALLFGRQRARIHHDTQEHALVQSYYTSSGYRYRSRAVYALRYHHSHNSTRSRSVTVPNLGGFAGFSVKYPNVKVSLGYRADFFFGAVDAGIDTRRTKDLGFQGPFATVSIGLGG